MKTLLRRMFAGLGVFVVGAILAIMTMRGVDIMQYREFFLPCIPLLVTSYFVGIVLEEDV